VSSPHSESLLSMFRDESGERLDRVVDTLLALERGETTDEAVHVMLRDVHSIKGAAGMLGLAGVGSIAHAMEDVLAAARAGGRVPPGALDPLLGAADALRAAVHGDDGGAEKALAALGTVGGNEAGTDPPLVAEPAPTLEDDAVQDAEGLLPREYERRSLRVDAGRLDTVVDTVSEAGLDQRRLEHLLQAGEGLAPEELDETLHRAGVRLDGLQHAVIGLRTVPLASITAHMPRLVRDVAAAAGKEVELQVTGAETQLDRAVLEGASEAISHLLRNAVAHGIESPGEREAAGKPRRGRVELRAEQRGDRVAIDVRDDGSGVASDLVARAAEGTPLVDVLAAPGFTRAEGPTELSGRGVGLDAVLEHVRRLGGELEVETEPGRGTMFTLLVPISLALLRVLMAERAGVLFAIPISAVTEVVEASDPLVLQGRSALEIRGEPVPLADPVAVLGGATGPVTEPRQAIVAAAGGVRAALACDLVVGDEEVLVRPLGRLLSATPGYLGAAVVGDGRVALVLDPAYVMPVAAREGARLEPAAARTDARQSAPAPAQILVVDDQFTVREIQRSILEAAGYRVVTARDGREAWDLLTNGEHVGLVVTDLEMPEMDGLELVRAIRGDPQRSSLPVVVVTSRGGEDDERKGLEAGADAYIAKERFDQRALLDTVERLVTA
jgi:two-component system, chemotaxis family, sensor kinase CheA